MWLIYFLAFAFVVTLVRVIIFAFSGGSFDDKLGKAKNWIIGLMLLSISWFVLAKLFGLNTSMELGNEQQEINSGGAFGTSDDNQDSNSNSVPIVLD
jgi:hypothetical protein